MGHEKEFVQCKRHGFNEAIDGKCIKCIEFEKKSSEIENLKRIPRKRNLNELIRDWEYLVQYRFNPKLMADFRRKYKGYASISYTAFGEAGYYQIFLKIRDLSGKNVARLFKTFVPYGEWEKKKKATDEILKNYRGF